MFYTFLSPLWWFKKLKERTQEIQPPRGTKRRRDEEPFRDRVTDEPGWTWNLDTPAVLNTSKFVGVFSALKCHFQQILFINGNKQVAIRFEKTWIFLRHGIDNIVHPIAPVYPDVVNESDGSILWFLGDARMNPKHFRWRHCIRIVSSPFWTISNVELNLFL